MKQPVAQDLYTKVDVYDYFDIYNFYFEVIYYRFQHKAFDTKKSKRLHEKLLQWEQVSKD
jgi:hypothetical protein